MTSFLQLHLAALQFVADTVQHAGKTLVSMGDAAKAFIAGWESEKYRKPLAARSTK